MTLQKFFEEDEYIDFSSGRIQGKARYRIESKKGVI
jgi:hypothetical protein